MDIIKKNFTIVCARYNEDIRWLLPFKHITVIYNKGDYPEILNKFETIILDNVGRESHTYLYHIVNNYENLSDKIIFFQGNISDHKILDLEDYFKDGDFIGKIDSININNLKDKIIHYGKYKNQYNSGNMKISNMSPFDWITKIAGINLENINSSKLVWGANFAVSKKLILNKPKIFYQNILRYIENHVNPEEGHFLERTWYIIYNHDYIPKPKIGFIYINHYFNYLEEILNKLNKLYDEIHVWLPINSNFDLGKYKNIYYTPNNFKYLTILPNIVNNSFTLNIKGRNDAHILIEFEKYEEKYEIVLGGWHNNNSVIRDYYNNIVLNSYDGKLLDNNNFIKFEFKFDDDNKVFKIIMNDKIILQTDHKFDNYNIKNIMIKSCFNSSIYWDYENNSNVKYFLCDKYQNLKNFYENNYLDNYIDEIDIFKYIDK